MIYEGAPSSQLTELAGVAIKMLKENSRCLFLNSPPMVAGFRSYLAAEGLNVTEQVEKGALILSSDQSHLLNGRFEPKRMLDMLKEALDKALNDGYTTLWATGDMMWELGSEMNFDRLLEYECGLDEVLKACPALCGICQYRKESLPNNAMQIALNTHEAIFVNKTLSQINPFYTKAAQLRLQGITASHEQVEQMLAYLSVPVKESIA